MIRKNDFQWLKSGQFYDNFAKVDSRSFFKLHDINTLKIALDQIDYGEFNGDVGFTQKLSSHVIIALEMSEKTEITS